MALIIKKTDTVPAVLEPSTLYFVKSSDSDLLTVHLTDKLGNLAYRTYQDSDAQAETMAILSSLMGQPNGIATLDASGNVDQVVIAIVDGQESSLMSNNNYVWRDLKADFVVKATSGTNNPTFGVWNGGNMQGLIFSASSMNQVWVDFHIDHDIALNTKVYPHVHWLPTTTAIGTVRWGMEYTIAKGHGQGAFPATVTVYVNHVISTNSRYVHMVSEVSDADAILSNLIEPDSVIKMRIFRDAANAADTYPGTIHAWQADIHYQTARIGTRNRAPNFFL